MLDRRGFLAATCGIGTALLAVRPAAARAGADATGALDAAGLGVRPGETDQTAALERALATAARAGRTLFLGPGRYRVSSLRLPTGARLSGVPGGTRLVAAADLPVLTAEGAERVSLSGITIDGANRRMRAGARGLVELARCRGLVVDGVEVLDGLGSGLVLEGCQGRVERSTLARLGDAGLFARDSTGLSVTGNTVTDIGNNGIQIWRATPGEDGSIVRGNRIERVRHVSGGNGQNGNGINVYRAGGVIVADNRTADCAFSGIRNNAGANGQISGNACLRSGEVAIFVEFGFEAVIVSGNRVEGAAAGISVTNFDHGGRLATVTGNLVRDIAPRSLVNPDTYPYGIAAEADAAVSGNVVENSAGFGLSLGWGPYLRDVTATGNLIRRADIGIGVSVVEGAGRAVVSDNIVAEARRGAVRGMRWRDVATEELRGREGVFRNVALGRNGTG
jgi:uncharacterized secreted repeat protein (TIGR03808 family)